MILLILLTMLWLNIDELRHKEKLEKDPFSRDNDCEVSREEFESVHTRIENSAYTDGAFEVAL